MDCRHSPEQTLLPKRMKGRDERPELYLLGYRVFSNHLNQASSGHHHVLDYMLCIKIYGLEQAAQRSGEVTVPGGILDEALTNIV